MINKQNLWFITLFSLILVLSIYYVTMPNNLLKDINSKKESEKTQETVSIKENETLTALRVKDDEDVVKEMNDLQKILLDEKKTKEEKSQAYDTLKELNLNKGKEQKLEQKILQEFNLKCFIKVKNDTIKIVIASKEHDPKLANNIIRSIQKDYDKQMYITVKFEA